jgi:leucyl aminopeptidase
MTVDSNASDKGALPLWLLYEDELEGWLATQRASVRQWLADHAFRGERHRVVLLADGEGTTCAAVAGLGKRHGALSLWHTAGLVERLPPQRFALRQSFAAADATQIALGFAYGAYRFERYKRAKPERVAQLDAPANADLTYVRTAARALGAARDWINTPAADFGPAELAAVAEAVGVRHGAVYRAWVGDELLAANFPAIHAVGRASASAPRLIELRWSPAGATLAAGGALPKLVLIGKGVCFDTGGLDIKPGAGMALMKKDMGGAAVALAVADLAMAANLHADIRVLIPAVENSISGNAYRPGDVLPTRKGLTVEVGNTDAEGRLILCDALALADAEKPDLMIDFATLTGAARVALGPELPALFGSDEAVVAEIARVAAAEHDPVWPMPLWAPYDEDLGSKVADLNNVASSTFAGAVLAGLFLKRFVTETERWVHIDLYAWNPKERPGRSVGAEPQAVRALYRYLLERYGSL